ncbi:MAG TPA: hypothetical protein VGP47_00835, partial [Parachlamydiaceae bacterium]|nr:hypothetical protein [Parachlamydiaceae bacterium]
PWVNKKTECTPERGAGVRKALIAHKISKQLLKLKYIDAARTPFRGAFYFFINPGLHSVYPGLLADTPIRGYFFVFQFQFFTPSPGLSTTCPYLTPPRLLR